MPKQCLTVWKCARCKLVNTGRAACYNCKAAKSEGMSLIVKPGDWICNICRVNNFNKRTHCYTCKRVKRAKEPVEQIIKEEVSTTFNKEALPVQTLFNIDDASPEMQIIEYQEYGDAQDF